MMYDVRCTIYQRKSAIQLTSVGLAHARPNNVTQKFESSHQVRASIS